MGTNKQKDEEAKKGKRRFWALVIIIILLLLLFFIFQGIIKERNEKLLLEMEAARKHQLELAIAKAQRIADSISSAQKDSIANANKNANIDSLRMLDSIRKADSLNNLNRNSSGGLLKNNDSLKTADSLSQRYKDSIANAKRDALRKLDSLRKADSLNNFNKNNTNKDSIPPELSILPPSGRYYKPINLEAQCAEQKCKTEISIGDSLNAVAGGKIENYNKTGKVYFRAIDSAGNNSAWELASYDMASDNNCIAENTFPVLVKGKTVCVDAFEYPNKAGQKPRNMISQDAAAQLCKAENKRLCSKDEWQAACKGNSNSRYPYGNSYNQTKCVTDLKSAKEPNRSGFAPHCRSWYGMYDMSGNLWEWTSSPAEREGLFLVAGGAWNTQNASSCNETKFSFYPQNEYPFVGFRCCK